MSSRSFVGMPWFVTWNTPQVLHAWPMSVRAFGSVRSMSGTDSELNDSQEGYSSSCVHLYESGSSCRELKSWCLGYS